MCKNENDDWYDYFIETIYKKYPKKSQLADALTDLLKIEKESVYRRLRKNILFSAIEIGRIASAWNISLDEIIGHKSNEIDFKVEMFDYFNPTDEEMIRIQAWIDRLENFTKQPNAEYIEILNQFSRITISQYVNLGRFYYLKWAYRYYSEKKILPYSEIVFSEKVTKLNADYLMLSKKIHKTTFIWDPMIFEHLLNDIRYFHSIYLITDEEKELIKTDLYNYLNNGSKVLNEGHWSATENKVELYISYTSIDSNYSCYYSDTSKLCRIHAFTMNEFSSSDAKTVEKYRAWIQSKKRSSVQISGADEKRRIEFLNKQYRLIDTL